MPRPLFRSTHDIRDYGAVRSGASIRTALNNAITIAEAAGRGVVYIPQGSWNLDDGSRTVTDAAITAATTTLTSASAAFTTADVGRYVEVTGAGPSGGLLKTFISAYISATQVTVVDAATATVSAATLVVEIRVKIPGSVNLVCSGGRSTIIKCTTARAGIDFGDPINGGERRGACGWFMIDPNGVATHPVQFFGGANWDGYDIRVNSLPASVGAVGFRFSSVQNIGIHGFEIQGGGGADTTGVEFDRGCKNITLSRGTVNDCSTLFRSQQSAKHPTNSAVTHPERIVISDVLAETTVAGGIPLHVTAGSEIFVRGGALNAASSSTCVKAELVDPYSLGASTGPIIIDSAQMQATSGTMAHVTSASTVCLDGYTNVKTHTTTFQVEHNNARIWVGPLVDFNHNTTTAKFSVGASGISRTEGQVVKYAGRHTLVKTTNQTKTNTTPAVIDEFSMYRLPRGSEWLIEGTILYDGDVAPGEGLSLTWTTPSGGTLQWEVMGYDVNDVFNTRYGTELTAMTFGSAGGGTTLVGKITGRLVTASTIGDVTLSLAQVVGSATASSVLTGSRLVFTQVR